MCTISKHVAKQCTTAGWGCIDCKKVLHENIELELTPIRTRAAELKAKPKIVDDALSAGTASASKIARETLKTVRSKMGFDA